MRAKGDWGELHARRYIEAAGFVIITNNYCVRGGEIDIIARSPQGELVFFEVKTRQREPVDHASVLPREKIRRLERAARLFIAQNGGAGAMRFDLLLLIPNEQTRQLRIVWYRNVGLTSW